MNNIIVHTGWGRSPELIFTSFPQLVFSWNTLTLKICQGAIFSSPCICTLKQRVIFKKLTYCLSNRWNPFISVLYNRTCQLHSLLNNAHCNLTPSYVILSNQTFLILNYMLLCKSLHCKYHEQIVYSAGRISTFPLITKYVRN